MKTKELLQMVPETTIEVIARCSGHDGTYAVKSEFRDQSMKICRPVIDKIDKADVAHYVSDCPMAAQQIGSGLQSDMRPENPFALLKLAYGID
jgi:Fe-S oxidoreductase